MNGSITLKGFQLEERARNTLLAYLQAVPFVQAEFLANVQLDASDLGYDGILHLRLPTGVVLAAIQVKPSGEIGVARQVAQVFNSWRHQFASSSSPSIFFQKADNNYPLSFALPYGIFVAPYISPRAAQFCQEIGIGYCDFAGNCHLSFGQVYIHRENWPDPNRKPQSVSLWAPKSQRILRVLLENPGSVWKTQSLASEANVSAGLISLVRGELADREWLEEKEGGFTLRDHRALLTEWAFHYKTRKKQVHSFYSLDGVPNVESILAAHCQRNNEAYKLAFTSFSGAARIASYAKYSQATAYIAGDVAQLARDTGLRPVDSGANIQLIEPYDEGLFYKSQVVDGVPIASPTQLYLDLRATGGRANDAAEYLLDTILKPRWEHA